MHAAHRALYVEAAYLIRVHHAGNVHVHPRRGLDKLCSGPAVSAHVPSSKQQQQLVVVAVGGEVSDTFEEQSGGAGTGRTAAGVLEIRVGRLDLPLVGGKEGHPPNLHACVHAFQDIG
jgi:hypothetical protein